MIIILFLKADEEGQIADWLVSAALGAAVNVAASFIIAQAMGQDFGVKDVAVAAMTGALGGGLGVVLKYGKYVNAVFNGVFVGSVAYRSGASLEAALITGGIAALFLHQVLEIWLVLNWLKMVILWLEMLWLLVVLI